MTPAEVQSAVDEHLTGDIVQVPPMVSALKVDGRRLHELAREGIEVERAARPVTVHRFDVRPTDDPLVYRIDVTCSSGTYVRTLADDLGRLLGGGAHLRALRRTEVGSFTLAEAHPLDELVLLPPAAAVRDLRAMTVDDATADGVRHGRVLDVAVASPTAVFDGGGVAAGRLRAAPGSGQAGRRGRRTTPTARLTRPILAPPGWARPTGPFHGAPPPS